MTARIGGMIAQLRLYFKEHIPFITTSLAELKRHYISHIFYPLQTINPLRIIGK